MGTVAVDEHVADHGRAGILEAYFGSRVDQGHALDFCRCTGVYPRVTERLAPGDGAILEMVERARDTLVYVLVGVGDIIEKNTYKPDGTELRV